MPVGGISDQELLKRLSATNSKAFVTVVAKELAEARELLVRACMSHNGAGFEAEKWMEVSRIYRRTMELALGRKSGKTERPPNGGTTNQEEAANGVLLSVRDLRVRV